MAVPPEVVLRDGGQRLQWHQGEVLPPLCRGQVPRGRGERLSVRIKLLAMARLPILSSSLRGRMWRVGSLPSSTTTGDMQGEGFQTNLLSLGS